MIRVISYSSDFEERWNNFVEKSKNGTFLFNRNYMDYHKDRFIDASLVFINSHDRICGLLPACVSNELNDIVVSHAGLTYGGLILPKDIYTDEVSEIFQSMLVFYRSNGYNKLIYKKTPSIYSNYPSEDDLYYLYRNNAQLIGRSLSSTIFMPDKLSFSELRKRKIKKAKKNNIRIKELSINTEFQEWQRYWRLLSEVLQERHQVNPVHSFQEISLLAKQFPNNIKLYVAYNSSNELCSGILIYEMPNIAHLQYISCNEDGLKDCALDFLLGHLISDIYIDKTYIDFGISTEQNGRLLNDGLIFQKQGYGARGICYDIYELTL